MDKYEQLTNNLEKGGKPAQVGEVRNFSGKDYKKMADGVWKPVVHEEQKKLNEMEESKEKSPRQKLQEKLEDKTSVTMAEKHLNDLQNGSILENKQTRSGKPVFTSVDSAIASGYTSADFREIGNLFYDRAQTLEEGMSRMEQSGQKVESTFKKIKDINLKLGKQFIAQANHIDDRQAKTKASVAKSVTSMGHNDAAEINTASFATELQASKNEGWWLEHIHNIMDGYQFGDVPRLITLSKGDLYLVKVDDGLYSGLFKTVTPVENGVLEDNAKVRLERMTLPTLIQFCLAKQWMEPYVAPAPQPIEPIQNLTTALQAPEPSVIDKKIQILELLNKLVN